MRLASSLLLTAVLTTIPAAQTGEPEVRGRQDPTPTGQALPSLNTGGGNAWFDNTRLNLGTFTEAKMARGTFHFHNPRKVAHELSAFRATCACARAEFLIGKRRYEILGKGKPQLVRRRNKKLERIQVPKIVVGPGERGRVVVYMKLGTFRGARDATLAFRTTDRRLPLVQLRWQATNLGTFVVRPEEVRLSRMTSQEQRAFEFEVTCNVRDDFALLGHGLLPAGMKVETEKRTVDGRTVWHVKGTYGPGARTVDKGGQIVFTTDIPGALAIMRVVADVVPPVLADPGTFVLLGNIPSAKGSTASVRLVVTDGRNVSITGIDVVKLRGIPEDQHDRVHFSAEKDGLGARMIIAIDPGLKPTTLSGEVTVHLDHPAMPTMTIKFIGNVR